MLETMMVSSGSVMYVMAAVGILGVLAKIVNRMTLYRLIKAAGNMPKSTHKLMKLVKAKYEHACMAHESVENVGVFVENQRIIAGNAQFTGIAAGRGVRFTTGLLLLGKGLGMRETPIRPHS